MRITSSSSDSSEDGVENPPGRRGVKNGTRRGKYRKYEQEKKRIIQAAVEQRDWKSVAQANGVAIQTAYGWIRKCEDEPKTRGGARRNKVTPDHVEKMISYVEVNPDISLQAIADNLRAEDGLSISSTTVHNYLDAQPYTVKKKLAEPSTMNSIENKTKRAKYCTDILDFIGAGKFIVYIDESNFNLFLRRTQGRSRKGTRCSVKAPTARGKNIHVIGGICPTGLVYWERRRGSYLKQDCHQWLRNLLLQLQEPLQNVVIVCDNAPVHSELELVAEEEEFEGVEILRLAPYSAPLNPIEECWSVLKSHVKQEMAATMPQMLNATLPAGMTQVEFRLQFLEDIIDRKISTITPSKCCNCINHVKKHYSNCIQMVDLKMGDIPQ